MTTMQPDRSEETLRWDESMWSANPPKPLNADVVRWPADSEKFVRQRVTDAPIYAQRSSKAEKAAKGADISKRIMRELPLRVDGMTSVEIGKLLGVKTHAISARLQGLRDAGLVAPSDKPIRLPSGGRAFIWKVVEKLAED